MAVLVSIILTLILLGGAAYIAARWGLKSLLLFTPLAILSVWHGISSGRAEEMANLLPPLFIGFFAGLTLNRGWQLKRYLLLCSLVIAVMMTGAYYGMRHFRGKDMVLESGAQVTRMLKDSSIPQEQKDQIQKDLTEWMPRASALIPFSSFFYGLLISALAMSIARPFASRLATENASKTGGLEKLRLNDYTIFILIAGWAVFLLVDKGRYPVLNMAGLNAGLITSILYLVQALGVIKFMLLKKGLPPYVLPFSLFLLAMLGMEMIAFTSILLSGLGAFDLWADFRKLNVPGGNS